jgi:hypothetical protein
MRSRGPDPAAAGELPPDIAGGPNQRPWQTRFCRDKDDPWACWEALWTSAGREWSRANLGNDGGWWGLLDQSVRLTVGARGRIARWNANPALRPRGSVPAPLPPEPADPE